jgi:hypothetical protein
MTKIKVSVQCMSAYLWLCEFSGIPPLDGCISAAGHQLCAWSNILSSALCLVKHIVISSVPGQTYRHQLCAWFKRIIISSVPG